MIISSKLHQIAQLDASFQNGWGRHPEARKENKTKVEEEKKKFPRRESNPDRQGESLLS